MEPFDRSTLSTFKYHGQGWGQGKNKFLPLQLQNTFDIKRKKYILHFMLRICIFLSLGQDGSSYLRTFHV